MMARTLDPLRLPSVCTCGAHGFIGLTHAAVALVDADFVPVLKRMGKLWFLQRGYAATGRSDNQGSWIRMHNLVLPTALGVWPDHINGDRADNRSSNLRPATPSQNTISSRKVKGKVPFRGVKIANSSGSFLAEIMVNQKRRRIGWFKTPEEAARAYDRAAVETHGEFAVTNVSLGLLGAAE